MAENKLGYDKIQSRLVYALTWETSHRSINFDGVVMTSFSTLHSGTLLTSSLGATKNEFMVRCAFKEMNPGDRFRDHMVFSALGDDNLPATKGGSEDKWKPEKVVETYAKFGMKLTPETKDGSLASVPREEVVMLRRTTVYHPDLGYRVGVLDERSIQRPFQLWEETKSPHAKFNELVRSQSREILLRGREAYDGFMTAMVDVANRVGIPMEDTTLVDYDDYIARIKDANVRRPKRNFTAELQSLPFSNPGPSSLLWCMSPHRTPVDWMLDHWTTAVVLRLAFAFLISQMGTLRYHVKLDISSIDLRTFQILTLISPFIGTHSYIMAYILYEAALCQCLIYFWRSAYAAYKAGNDRVFFYKFASFAHEPRKKKCKRKVARSTGMTLHRECALYRATIPEISALNAAIRNRPKHGCAFKAELQSGTFEAADRVVMTTENVTAEIPDMEDEHVTFSDGTLLGSTDSRHQMPDLIYREVLVTRQALDID
jgi:hypothetical protein